MRVSALATIAMLIGTFSMGQVVLAQPAALAAAKSIRCTFSLHAVGTWDPRDAPTASTKPATLTLRFDTLNVEDGTAMLRNGTVGSDIVLRSSGTFLHFMQSFRTGAMYMTTVFDQKTSRGRYKAVHSRHEYYATPLAGATSSPEQYYGDCEVM